MRLFFFMLSILTCLPSSAFAHKVNLFAYVDGNSIVTESGYSRTNRVNKGTVTMYAPDGTELDKGTTDEKGHLVFPIPEDARKGMDLRLVLYAGEGHGAEWTIKASEISGIPESTPTSTSKIQSSTVAASAESTIPAAALEATVDKVIKRELAPVKVMLAEMHDTGPGMTEIFGGIGWLVGLAGLLAYARSRQ